MVGEDPSRVAAEFPKCAFEASRRKHSPTADLSIFTRVKPEKAHEDVGGECHACSMNLPVNISLMRIVAQGLVPETTSADPHRVVRRMLATQGQLPSAVPHSLIVRTATSTAADVAAAFTGGRLVRFWPFRGTLHIVAAEDHHWLRALWGTRGGGWFERAISELRMSQGHVDYARTIAAIRLAAGPATRADLRSLWVSEGLAHEMTKEEQNRLVYVMFVQLHRDGTMVSGPLAGNEHLLVKAEPVSADLTGWAERIEDGDAKTIRRAYAEIARRYAITRGPITVADLARWTGAEVTACRQALEDALRGPTTEDSEDLFPGIALTRVHLEGMGFTPCPAPHRSHRDFYMRADLPDMVERSRRSALKTLYLAAFDELHVGYKDRSCLTDVAGEKLICPGGNGMFRPLIIDRGRMVAVNPKSLGLTWYGTPSQRVQRDTERVIRSVERRLGKE